MVKKPPRSISAAPAGKRPGRRPPKPGGRIPQVEAQRAYRARLAAAGKLVRVVDAISVRGSIRISGVAGARPGQITVCPPSVRPAHPRNPDAPHQGANRLAELSMSQVLYSPGYQRTRRGHLLFALRESTPREVTWNVRSGVRIRNPHSSNGLE